METLILYALCSASAFYLGSRAIITRWLWSKYPSSLTRFMDCAACSGTWYGAAIAYVGGYHLGLNFMGLPGDSWPTVVVASICSMTTTPIMAGFMQHGFDTLGSVEEAEEDSSESGSG